MDWLKRLRGDYEYVRGILERKELRPHAGRRILWLGVNEEGIWLLEHEGDYELGDKLIRIETDLTRDIIISIREAV